VNRVLFRMAGGGFVSCHADFEVKTIGYSQPGRALLGVEQVEVHKECPAGVPPAENFRSQAYNAVYELVLRSGRRGLLCIQPDDGSEPL
jgi:hypothetical protein